ncbi:hypothetical protein HDU96_004840 [Phlyctochytrium bullatum]|nr:hypothetical protein HDU96_004840 [Phlyctochytrium bullatum]
MEWGLSASSSTASLNDTALLLTQSRKPRRHQELYTPTSSHASSLREHDEESESRRRAESPNRWTSTGTPTLPVQRIDPTLKHGGRTVEEDVSAHSDSLDPSSRMRSDGSSSPSCMPDLSATSSRLSGAKAGGSSGTLSRCLSFSLTSSGSGRELDGLEEEDGSVPEWTGERRKHGSASTTGQPWSPSLSAVADGEEVEEFAVHERRGGKWDDDFEVAEGRSHTILTRADNFDDVDGHDEVENDDDDMYDDELDEIDDHQVRLASPMANRHHHEVNSNMRSIRDSMHEDEFEDNENQEEEPNYREIRSVENDDDFDLPAAAPMFNQKTKPPLEIETPATLLFPHRRAQASPTPSTPSPSKSRLPIPVHLNRQQPPASPSSFAPLTVLGGFAAASTRQLASHIGTPCRIRNFDTSHQPEPAGLFVDDEVASQPETADPLPRLHSLRTSPTLLFSGPILSITSPDDLPDPDQPPPSPVAVAADAPEPSPRRFSLGRGIGALFGGRSSFDDADRPRGGPRSPDRSKSKFAGWLRRTPFLPGKFAPSTSRNVKLEITRSTVTELALNSDGTSGRTLAVLHTPSLGFALLHASKAGGCRFMLKDGAIDPATGAERLRVYEVQSRSELSLWYTHLHKAKALSSQPKRWSSGNLWADHLDLHPPAACAEVPADDVPKHLAPPVSPGKKHTHPYRDRSAASSFHSLMAFAAARGRRRSNSVSGRAGAGLTPPWGGSKRWPKEHFVKPKVGNDDGLPDLNRAAESSEDLITRTTESQSAAADQRVSLRSSDSQPRSPNLEPTRAVAAAAESSISFRTESLENLSSGVPTRSLSMEDIEELPGLEMGEGQRREVEEGEDEEGGESGDEENEDEGLKSDAVPGDSAGEENEMDGSAAPSKVKVETQYGQYEMVESDDEDAPYEEEQVKECLDGDDIDVDGEDNEESEQGEEQCGPRPEPAESDEHLSSVMSGGDLGPLTDDGSEAEEDAPQTDEPADEPSPQRTLTIVKESPRVPPPKPKPKDVPSISFYPQLPPLILPILPTTIPQPLPAQKALITTAVDAVEALLGRSSTLKDHAMKCGREEKARVESLGRLQRAAEQLAADIKRLRTGRARGRVGVEEGGGETEKRSPERVP